MGPLKMSLVGLAVLIPIGATAAALAPPTDIRPDAMGTSETDVRRGRALLEGLPGTYGGQERWRSATATRVDMRDFWPDGISKRVASPWHDDERIDLTFLNGRDMGRLTFRGGQRDGTVWGIQNWVTYTETPQGQRQFAPDDAIEFWLPTIQYFLELPFRIGEADRVTFAGTVQLEGATYDRVYATWGSFEPQSAIDQYVVWINRATGRVDYLQYTVRDMGKWLTGTAHYGDLREVDGLLVPFKMTVGGQPGSPETLHRFDIAEVSFDPELPISAIEVDPTRRASKH